MSQTDTSTLDSLTAAAERAWLDYAKGTYSETDKRIFIAGFRQGVRYKRKQDEAQQRYEDEYERQFGSRRECY